MTAVARLGGEWTPGYAGPEAGRGIHGLMSNRTQYLTGIDQDQIVEPGRTGGACFRHYGGPTATGIGPQKLSINTTIYADIGLQEAPGLHGGFGNPDPYMVPDGEFLIGRAYARISALPDAPGATTPGIPIMVLGGIGIWLGNDGSFRITGAGESYPLGYGVGAPTDGDLEMPVNEWVMLEIATNWMGTAPRSAFVRVTLPGEEPVVIYRNCALVPVAGPVPASMTVGCMQYQATIFATGNFVSPTWYIDFDDLGLNTSEGEENNTWLGPGVVHCARPIDDGDVGPAWDLGDTDNIYRGESGRTVSHPYCCGCEPPLVLDEARGGPFADALNNNPVLNPASAPSLGSGVRGRGYDRIVVSVGTDFHPHDWLSLDLECKCPSSEIRCVVAYKYDMPRIAYGGDTLNVICDASVRFGALSFARVVAFAGKQAWYGGPSDTIQFPFRGDYYFSMWSDNEEEPRLGGPEGAAPPGHGEEGFSDDLAHTNFGMWAQTTIGIEAGWHGALGRMQQLPELAETPTLSIRREHFQHAVTEPDKGGPPPDVNGTGETDYGALQEFAFLGAGIIYESGYVPQDPLPDCEPGELVIGPMQNHFRQIRGGRVGSSEIEG